MEKLFAAYLVDFVLLPILTLNYAYFTIRLIYNLKLFRNHIYQICVLNLAIADIMVLLSLLLACIFEQYIYEYYSKFTPAINQLNSQNFRI